MAAVGGERTPRAPGDPLQHIIAGRQIMKLHAPHPPLTRSVVATIIIALFAIFTGEPA
jgi:hypothetical protein